MESIRTTAFPWHDSTKWKQGHWYPIPEYYNADDDLKDEDNELIWNKYIDGWGIFTLDLKARALSGDIIPISRRMTFMEAREICESHNQEKLPL